MNKMRLILVGFFAAMGMGVFTAADIYRSIEGWAGGTLTGDVTASGDLIATGSDVTLGTAGVKLTGDGDGAVTLLGLGNGADENLTINLDDTANTAVISSSTALDLISLTSIGLTVGADLTVSGSDVTIDAAGVKLTGDGDGALTILGLGNGSDEDLTINLDDTSNAAVITSSTGVTDVDLGAIKLKTASRYPLVGKDATTLMTFETGAGNVGSTNTFTTAFASAPRIYIQTTAAITNVNMIPYPSSITASNFVISGTGAEPTSWLAIGAK